jgi:hypothetical protein
MHACGSVSVRVRVRVHGERLTEAESEHTRAGVRHGGAGLCGSDAGEYGPCSASPVAADTPRRRPVAAAPLHLPLLSLSLSPVHTSFTPCPLVHTRLSMLVYLLLLNTPVLYSPTKHKAQRSVRLLRVESRAKGSLQTNLQGRCGAYVQHRALVFSVGGEVRRARSCVVLDKARSVRPS